MCKWRWNHLNLTNTKQRNTKAIKTLAYDHHSLPPTLAWHRVAPRRLHWICLSSLNFTQKRVERVSCAREESVKTLIKLEFVNVLLVGANEARHTRRVRKVAVGWVRSRTYGSQAGGGGGGGGLFIIFFLLLLLIIVILIIIIIIIIIIISTTTSPYYCYLYYLLLLLLLIIIIIIISVSIASLVPVLGNKYKHRSEMYFCRVSVKTQRKRRVHVVISSIIQDTQVWNRSFLPLQIHGKLYDYN